MRILAVLLTAVVALAAVQLARASPTASPPVFVETDPTGQTSPPLPKSVGEPALSTTSTTTTTTSIPSPTTTLAPLAADELRDALAARFAWLESVEERSAVEISAAVWIEAHGDAFSYAPNRRLHPASNQKLLVAAGAFELLDLQSRFTTAVHEGARPDELIVVASGDPTLTFSALDDLASAVAAKVSDPVARLVIDASVWDEERVALGWQDWQMPTYVGPLGAFMVDDNRWTTDAEFVDNPDLVNGRRFADSLRVVGLAGEIEVVVATDVERGALVAAHSSAPLIELVVDMMHASDNQIAEALVRHVAVVAGEVGSTSLGLQKIRAALDDAGVVVGGEDGDGSGLSRANYRSADEWRRFLVSVQDQPWFVEWISTIPLAGRDGTLRSRLGDPPTGGNVQAKTGTIIGGRALSGYLELASGEFAVFSITINGDDSDVEAPTIDRFVTELAEFVVPDV